MHASMTPRNASGLRRPWGIIMLVRSPCCRPGSPHVWQRGGHTRMRVAMESRALLAHLTHEHRYPKPLPSCLARQQSALPLRQLAAYAVVLGLRVRQKTGPEEDRVFAVLLPERVHTFI